MWRKSIRVESPRQRDKVSTTCLEVKNIPEDTRAADLRELFQKYGEVFYVRIHADYEWVSGFREDAEWDPNTGYTNVKGLITMPDAQAELAKKALHGRRWRGRELQLDPNPWYR